MMKKYLKTNLNSFINMETKNETEIYKILVFTWNSKSIPLENYDISFPNPMNKIFPYILPNPVKADFYPKLKEKIIEESPDIFVIGFQEDRKPGSYFHSHFLPTKMKELDYCLLKRTRLMGLGLTSLQGVKNLDFFERGLRMSVYCKKNLESSIINEEYEMRTSMGDYGQSYYYDNLFMSKGAIVSYIILPKVGRIAFICCHLPFDSNSLILCKDKDNVFLRQNAINISNVCFNKIIEELVLKRSTPDFAVIFGDLNYRVSYKVFTDPAKQPSLKELYDYDELKSQMKKENIFAFSEGIDNEGPNFLPTAKLDSNRDFKWGKYNQRIPSWCDRILYSQFKENKYRFNCLKYERFDYGVAMSMSDHAAVLGTYNFLKN